MAKTILLGDPHIGKGVSTFGKPGLGSALNSRVVDQLNILEWVLRTAVSNDVKNIILTGDVFEDTKPHPTLITLFISWLKQCSAENINVHIIQGNHDILRSGQFYISALDIVSEADIENIYVYKDIATIHLQGASFTLVPFKDRRSFNTNINSEALKTLQEKFPYELADIDRNSYKVVVGHLTLEGAIPVGDEIDDLTNELFCPVEMFKGYDYVWMGHVHKPQVLSKFPYVSHIGSMDLSNFLESNQDKVIVIFDPDKANPYQYIKIPTRPLKQISVSVPADIKDGSSYVIEQIKEKENLNKAIVRLNVSFDNPGAMSLDRTKIEESLNAMGTFYISRISEQRKISLIKKDDKNNIDNTVNETTAIKMYADLNVEEQDRNDFTALAGSLIKEYTSEGVK